jgi:hypothetical protein
MLCKKSHLNFGSKSNSRLRWVEMKNLRVLAKVPKNGAKENGRNKCEK